MWKKKLLLHIVLLSLFCSSKGSAQAYSYRMYTMQDGLSQMKITDLHLDSNNYLWLGTRNGLNRFNGENFQIITSQDGLSHDRIHRVNEDNDGRLVILTYQGIDLYDGQHFESYHKAFKNVQYDLEVDKENRILICEREIERKLWILENGTFKNIYHQKNPNKYISMVSSSNSGSIYFTNGDSLFTIQGDMLELVKDYDDGIALMQGAKGESYLIETLESTLLVSEILPDTIIAVASIDLRRSIELIIDDLKINNIWFVKSGNLLLPGTLNKRILFKDQFPNIRDVILDYQNQFWIASDNGLVQVDNQAFQSYSTSILPNIWTVVEDSNKNIWFGSFGEGLFKKPYGHDTVLHFFDIGHCFAGSDSDSEGNLFFAHEYNLAIVKNNKVSVTWDKTVFCVRYDENRDQVVFGTFEGIGILKNNKITYLGPDEGIHDNGYIQNIGIDKNGHYWTGSYTGLSLIDPESSTCEQYTQQNGKLPCNGIFCSYLDEEGNFWLGGDIGVMKYDYENNSFDIIESYVVDSRVKSITKFDDDHLILGTKEGIYIFDKRTYLNKTLSQFYYFNATNGYHGIDPGFTGMLHDSEGYIWICSATSVARLDPNKLILKNQELNPRITHINEQAIGFRHDSIFHNSYGQSSMVIGFEATGFDRQFESNYQYRIDNGSWSDWMKEKQVILNDLHPGEHLFEVRAGPSDLLADESKTDKIAFEIHLPFYKYPWFPPVGIALGLVLLGLAAFYFIRQRLEHNKYIQQLNEARYLRSQLLLAELNPHFIFNVLASIQHKVLFESKEIAADYVVKLSRLMRNYLNASHKANQLHTGKPEYEISLSKEIELLQDFMSFEKLKNNDLFEFHLIIEEGLEIEYVMIPPMLIQPFVENSIKHGLLLSEKKGNLWVKFSAIDEDLLCIIEDDGVGIEKSSELKKKRIFKHESLGSKIVKERIDLLNKLGYQIEIDISSREPSGTIVRINLKGEL